MTRNLKTKTFDYLHDHLCHLKVPGYEITATFLWRIGVVRIRLGVFLCSSSMCRDTFKPLSQSINTRLRDCCGPFIVPSDALSKSRFLKLTVKKVF